MIAQGVGTTSYKLLYFPIEIVRLTAVVLTEIHVYLIELNAEFRKVETGNRSLQEVNLAVRVPNLRREVITPIGVPVDVVGREFSTALVKVLVEFELIQITVGWREIK